MGDQEPRPHAASVRELLLKYGMKATTFGAASGVVAGLVAITPSCGAVVVGLAAGVVCSFAIGLKVRFGYDDSLGVVGVLLIGFLATEVMTQGSQCLSYGGGLAQLGKQLLAAAVVAAYAEGVHGHLPPRRPGPFGPTLGLRQESAEDEQSG